MTRAPIIAIKDLTKRYNAIAAIEAVSFSVAAGEVVGFVGLNGAGKSTTINILLGFLRATSGSVELFGQRITPENAHRSHHNIGFASGDMTLFGNLTGKQYLAFVAHCYNLKDRTRLDELIDRFAPQMDKKIRDLSRGNKQKIALITSFMCGPKLVILDEPSSGLDPLMQQLFVELIREESTRGTTIFMSSHYLNEVVDVCSRVLLIKDGKLIKDMPAQQLIGTGGKLVHIISAYYIEPPEAAELIVRAPHNNGFELSFVYKSDPAQLQLWFGGIPEVIDWSVADHTIESAFEDLYELETGKEIHV